MYMLFTSHYITSLTIIFVFVINLTIITSRIIIKSDTLTPKSPHTYGAYVLHHIDEVTTVNNNEEWRVITDLQNTWQFIIVLDKTWGFNPYEKSEIEFTVNSPTIAHSNTFSDILFGFTTNSNNNNEYISMLVPIHGDTTKIYPNCFQPNTNIQSTFANGIIASVPNWNRDCDLLGRQCTDWTNMKPENFDIPNTFPITIKAISDPKLNTFDLSFTSSTSITQTCSFVNFPYNDGFKIYIGGNDIEQQFLMQSFSIKYSILPPTSQPTYEPTSSPTKFPISQSTIYPTKIPTLIPTKFPISQPTIYPTKIPTLIPTQFPISQPSNNPSKSPIKNPTHEPTKLPTLIPTKLPTLIPTNYPSNIPSMIPSSTPKFTTLSTMEHVKCGDYKSGYLGTNTLVFPLEIPYNIEKLNINTCAGFTDFNTTLTLFQYNNYNTMEQIAFDSNGCNDMIGRSQIVLNNINNGIYYIVLESVEKYQVEAVYRIDILCTMPQKMVQFCNLFV